MHRCTVPSPPHAMTSSAPSSSARFDLLRRLAALRHLVPERIGDARLLERAAEGEEPVAERLAGVRDDRDLHARASRRACAARVMRARAERDDEEGEDPDHDPAEHVERVVHPAVDPRERDERAGSASATTQIAIRAARFLTRRVASSARPT